MSRCPGILQDNCGNPSADPVVESVLSHCNLGLESVLSYSDPAVEAVLLSDLYEQFIIIYR